MRTALTLDPDVFEAAQALARGSGKRLGRVVSDLARRGLREWIDRLPVVDLIEQPIELGRRCPEAADDLPLGERTHLHPRSSLDRQTWTCRGGWRNFAIT